MLWTLASNHSFDVRNYYKLLQVGEICPFLWKSIWKVKALPCIPFFIWTTSLGRILTVDKLRRCGCTFINWYCFGKKNEENVISASIESTLLILLHGSQLIWSFVDYVQKHPRVVTLLEESRAQIFQIFNLESYSFVFNVEHLERKELSLF